MSIEQRQDNTTPKIQADYGNLLSKIRVQVWKDWKGKRFFGKISTWWINPVATPIWLNKGYYGCATRQNSCWFINTSFVVERTSPLPTSSAQRPLKLESSRSRSGDQKWRRTRSWRKIERRHKKSKAGRRQVFWHQCRVRRPDRTVD